MEVSGKRVLLTGASGGLGARLAHALADAGCIVDDARCRSLAVDVLAGEERVQVMLIACL